MEDWIAPEEQAHKDEIDKYIGEIGYNLYDEMEKLKSEKKMLCDTLKAKFGMPTTLVNKLIKIKYEESIEEEKQSSKTVANAYEAIFGESKRIGPEGICEHSIDTYEREE